MIILEKDHLLKDKEINIAFNYLLYLYGVGFTIFMMYVSHRSMTIMENAVNNLNKYKCITNLILHDLKVNTSSCMV